MERVFPPAGTVPWRVKTALDGLPEFEFMLSMPKDDGEDSQVNLGTVMVGRLGGPSEADARQRERVYFAVGRATVASGHIETAMKRLVIVLRNLKSNFSLVDKTWTDLQKILVKEADRAIVDDPFAQLRIAVGNELRLAEKYGLKNYRDNIVHGYIWDYDMSVVVTGRFTRKSDGATIVWQLDELETAAKRLYLYGQRLEALLHGIWAEAVLDTANPELSEALEKKGYIVPLAISSDAAPGADPRAQGPGASTSK